MKKEYSISENGDWLEREAADFIKINIPSYEQIWRLFIGNNGKAKIARMEGIELSQEKERIKFSQHHYTILESLYFMYKIWEDESKLNQILDFNSYRRALNQLIAFQAYSGRLRDNIVSCFQTIDCKHSVAKVEERFEKFYHSRNIFLHGRKVPLSLDDDNLFRIAKVKDLNTSNLGFGFDTPWDSISSVDTEYFVDAYKNAIDELIPMVEGILSNLLGEVKNYVSKHNLKLVFDWNIDMIGIHTSGVSNPIIFNVSGSTSYDV